MRSVSVLQEIKDRYRADKWRDSYVKPHPSKRGKVKGWAFSFVVDYDGHEAMATSLNVYPTFRLASQAKTQFLLNMNALERHNG
jgi:hypothetical protein